MIERRYRRSTRMPCAFMAISVMASAAAASSNATVSHSHDWEV